ncbi:MAG: putative porin [Oligoflexia bacterium]|nr:putative porin [Oligoflexia bacterium]
MKKLTVLAVASLFATTAFAGDMKWSGHAGWRYRIIKNNEAMSSTAAAGTAGQKATNEITTKQHQYTAGIGANGGWENVEWGAGIRTTGSATSSYTTFTAGGDATIALEQAWFRYLRDFGDINFNVTVGRQMNALAYDSVGQGLFDKDARWDGFGWQWKMGMFGLNAAQYITGAKSGGANGASTYSTNENLKATATSSSHMNTLMAFQPHMTWKFTDEIETFFAVGYYVWTDDSNTNRSRGGLTTTIENLNTGTTPAADITAYAYRVHNPRQWHFYNKWSLPYNLKLSLEYVMNKKSILNTNSVAGYGAATVREPEVSKSMFSGSLVYGSLEKAHDFTVGYTYQSKGIASVINTYTNSDFLADNKGHVFSAGYALADNFHLGFKGFFMKEKEKLQVTGAATDGLAYQSPNGGQEMKTTAFHFTTGVMF